MTTIMNSPPETERPLPASASNDPAAERKDGLGSVAPRAEQPTKLEHVVPLSLRESERELLRPIVAKMGSAITSLQEQLDTTEYAKASAVLVARWRSLVEIMALGAPPEMRACPHCGYHINAIAIRCIECWKMSEREPRSLP